MLARAAEAGLHFIRNAHAARLAHDVVDDLHVSRGRSNRAADALNRLSNKRRHLAGRFVLDDVLDIVSALQPATRMLQPEGAAITVWRKRMLDVK